MANRIVLISDDSDFFDYIRTKLELRKSDELFSFAFRDIDNKLQFLSDAVFIINSENNNEKTLELIKKLRGTPSIILSFNEDDVFKRKCYRAGMFDYMTLLTPDAEFRARMIPALSVASLLEKNKQYRNILERKNVISSESEVFIDYADILDKELEAINAGVKRAVFVAISPNDKSKFLIKPEDIEQTILQHVRKNDILMNFAPNKYFLLIFDTDLISAQKLWEKISLQFEQKMFAGFVLVSNQKRQQLINEALNKLHVAINYDKNNSNSQATALNILKNEQTDISQYTNFKLFKQEFSKKVEQVITPAFYQVQQKYSGKFVGVSIEQESKDGVGYFVIKDRYSISCFKISCVGFSKINIDITYQKDANNIDSKRIALDPEELEMGLLIDLLEQFVLEYMRGSENDS